MKIYQPASLLDAQLVCDLLLSHGIDARVSGSYLTGAIGELPLDSVVAVWIIDESDEARARGILDEMEASRKLPATSAPCEHCAAEVFSNFNNCWKCGRALD